MTAQNEEKGLTEAKTKATKGKKKASEAVGSAGKSPANAKSEPKPKAAKKAPKAANKAPKAGKAPRSAQTGKGDKIVELLQRKGGTTLAEMQKASGWQSHSVRGFLSGIVRKKMGLAVTSVKPEGGERTYWIES